jgi:hypothetical protein
LGVSRSIRLIEQAARSMIPDFAIYGIKYTKFHTTHPFANLTLFSHDVFLMT